MNIRTFYWILSFAILLSSCNSKMATLTNFAETPYYEWNKIGLSDATFCSDSSEYYLMSKRGKTNNLIIHFAGGGACWDDETCTTPIEFNLSTAVKMGAYRKVTSYYIDKIPKGLPNFMKGVFDNDNPENPFQDWNIVFIPYCTGDIHIGNAVNEYSYEEQSRQVFHNGQNNVQEALKWIQQHFKNPNKILLSGSSAGGFASLFYSQSIAETYNQSKVYQLADCSYVYSGKWSQILDSTWQVDWNETFGFEMKNDAVKEAYLNAPRNSNITYLQINSLYDFVLTQFWAIANEHSREDHEYIKNWSTQMTEMVAEIAQTDLDYRYFVTNYKFNDKRHDTPHTFLNRAYYKCEQNGVLLTEWLRQNVIEDKKSSVGKQFLSVNY